MAGSVSRKKQSYLPEITWDQIKGGGGEGTKRYLQELLAMPTLHSPKVKNGRPATYLKEYKLPCKTDGDITKERLLIEDAKQQTQPG